MKAASVLLERSMRHMVTIGLCAFVLGCGVRSSPATPGTAVAFEVLGADVVSPFNGGPDNPRRAVLKSRAEWEEAWKQIEPRTSRDEGQVNRNPLPAIDFRQHALVMAAMGMRSDGCCSVEILSIVETTDHLVVAVLERVAGPGCMVTLAVTHPIALVRMPQTSKEVRFDVVSKIQQCE
jgi:PrcB C-terminal